MQECRTRDVWCGIRAGEQRASDWGVWSVCGGVVCLWVCACVDGGLGENSLIIALGFPEITSQMHLWDPKRQHGRLRSRKIYEAIMISAARALNWDLSALHYRSKKAQKAHKCSLFRPRWSVSQDVWEIFDVLSAQKCGHCLLWPERSPRAAQSRWEQSGRWVDGETFSLMPSSSQSNITVEEKGIQTSGFRSCVQSDTALIFLNKKGV